MLHQHLQSLGSKIEGCHAALLVGSDGLIVDSWMTRSDCPIEQIAAQGSQFLRCGLEMLEAIPETELRELALVSDRQKILLRAVSSSYFVVLLLAENSLLGQARHYLHCVESHLAQELA